MRPNATSAPRIVAPGPDGLVPVARGCLVAADLVLTRAVPAPDGEGYRVACGSDTYGCRLLTQHRDDVRGVEAALFEIDDPAWAPSRDYVPPRWGAFTGSLHWTAAAILDGEAEHPVEISPLSWRRPARWDLRHAPLPATTGGEPSGAPVFAGDLLTGVAIREAGDQWTAVPVAALVDVRALRQPIEERLGRPVHLEPVELAGLLAPWTPLTAPRVAADLLDPRRAVTPFTGYADVLDQLLAWCDGGPALAGLLVAGAPGHGKTRLAREAAARLHARGWLVGDVAATTLADSWLRHLAAADRPVLLAFDGAGGLDTAGAVAAHLSSQPPRHPVRLLVTAPGDAAGWVAWRERPGSPGALAFAEAPLVVPGFPSGAGLAPAAARRWSLALAAGLEGLVEPADVERRLSGPGAGRLPAWAAGGSPETAAVAVLATLLADDPPANLAAAEEVVLADAVDRWTSASARHGERVRSLALPAIDLAALIRPADEAEATKILAGLPGASGVAELADWVRTTCPPAEPDQRYWGTPLPARLRGRRLVAACADAGLVAAVRRLDTPHTPFALARLAEAAPYGEPPAELLRVLVLGDPVGWGAAAIRAIRATAAPDPLVAVLRELGRADLAAEARVALADALPTPAGALAEVEVPLREQLVAGYRRSVEGGQRQARSLLATELLALSRALAEAGRAGDALATAREAVDRHREQREVAPAPGVLRGLRTALRTLAIRHLALDQDGPAAEAAREAVELCREAESADREVATWLAADLEFLGAMRLDGGEPEAAAEAYDEAVRAHRRAAAEGRATPGDGLGVVLCGLSDALAACGRTGPAAGAMAEAVVAYERLAATDPQTYQPTLAVALEVLAGRLAAAGRTDEAVQAAERAVRVHRRLGEQARDERSTDHAEALRRLSDLYAVAERADDALSAAHESVERHRTAAAEHMVSAGLCAALHTLARRYDEMDQTDYAADAAVEAANGYRRLVERGQEEHRAALAGALSNAAVLRGRQGIARESEPLARQALQAAAALDSPDPAQLAAIRNNLAIVLGAATGRPGGERLLDESASLAEQAVRGLDERDPAGLVRALLTLARQRAATGDTADSVAAAERAVEVCAGLGVRRADLVLAAEALGSLAERYAEAVRFAEAAAAVERARDAHRRLVRMGLARHRAGLGDLAMLQAGMPSDVVSPLAAAGAADEAVACYRELAAEQPERFRPSLVAALDRSAQLYGRMDRGEDAYDRMVEAIEVGRTLVATVPHVHTADQAARLRWLAERLEATDPEAARDAAEEAFALSREVSDPKAGRHELAASAALLARLLPHHGTSEEGARPMLLANTAANRFEELARERPDIYLGELAGVLMHRAGLKAAVGNVAASAADADEAVTYHREVAANRAAHRPALAQALLDRLELPADDSLDRIAVLRETTEIYGTLSQDAPEPYLPRLARAQIRLAGELSSRGRRHRPESLREGRLGVDILADLAEQRPAEFGAEAVKALLDHAQHLVRAGRDVEAQGIRGRAARVNGLLGSVGASATEDGEPGERPES
ncbi:hypothetical protein RB614_32800 [Phytohabitans sp. ZYX-F-186]|uniref:Tetratricopeptide repeat protein n=1 Tax=Phytohabitans maris TaxID=3071409 RepID=A0ABU0ZQK6_9ACTN|nr:hypothetical protein [Phytohabitans sp. ZYX-F-186]MDQ7909311.1 hypothetical protein [Phytohabitans sp. ZYX-F-186]